MAIKLVIKSGKYAKLFNTNIVSKVLKETEERLSALIDNDAQIKIKVTVDNIEEEKTNDTNKKTI